jgi:hypothetical protein
MEMEKRIATFPVPSSRYNFDLLNIDYTPKPYVTKHEMKGPYNLLEKGYVDLPTEGKEEGVSVELIDAGTETRSRWDTTIKHATYSVDEIREPSPENPKKYEFATAHFNRINEYLKKQKDRLRYDFNFLTPLTASYLWF